METFAYDGTAELGAFLKWCDDNPYPPCEPKGKQEVWTVAWKKLKSLVDPKELDAYNRAKREWMCKPSTQQGDATVHTSPCDKYTLTVTSHSSGQKGTWNLSKGVVTTTAGDVIVARNYSHFPFAWVSHPNGYLYLVCGENYQGQTVVELDTGKRVDHLPKAAEKGFGFCWVKMVPNPKGDLLAVEGCVWGAPYKALIVDFSQPMSPPYEVLCRPEGRESEFMKWAGDDQCSLRYSLDRVNLPGHALHGESEYVLDMKQLEEIEAEVERRGLVDGQEWDECVEETMVWSR